MTDFPVTPIYFVRFDSARLLPQIDSQHLGLIAAGVSRHPDDLVPAVVPAFLDYKNVSPGDPGGVTVPVQHREWPGRDRLANLLSRFAAANKPGASAGGPSHRSTYLTLSLEPTPNAPEVPSNAKWAVALNFKDGNQDDLSSDQVIVGATCHFLGNGQPTLGFVNTVDAPPPASTYADYRANRTSFQLTVRVKRNFEEGSLDASLKVGNAVQHGAYAPPPPIDLTAIPGFPQVGIAIVNVKDATTIVRTRLQSFALWMNP